MGTAGPQELKGRSIIVQTEMQVEQKRRLSMLLTIKAANKDIQIKELDNLILATKVEMQQEDVAWVEKMITEGQF